ncbi:zinc-ribbon domain-containing protein [Pseudidiomarina taiwanensis]|uniref:Zinc ribbon domain-containing protein n=1 Tax=Pseudidiomarina taiwanensis TaxID=337250 RepID=A0A432ZN94_9GAMM|nr:zinc-ribbon domain-containing protein [Pseudidiomarina taiwanensis]RUO79346.1 hypothetical protein CWI83_02230 [Pseudidiomarina taiwanensis]
MALIDCPACHKRVSDKAKECQHCGFKLATRSSAEHDRELRRALQDKRDSILSQSMLALLIAIAAFAYFYVAQPLPDSWQAQLAYAGMLVGSIWFIVNRVRLVFLKKKP